MKHLDKNKIIICVALAIICICSFALSGKISSEEKIGSVIEYLAEKEHNVMALTASSAGASVLISMIPGDIGTPIAQEIAELSKWFLIVLSAVFLEKYLFTIILKLTFRWLLPIGCIVIILGIVFAQKSIETIGKKLAIFAILAALVIPGSVWISREIEAAYKFNEKVSEISGAFNPEDIEEPEAESVKPEAAKPEKAEKEDGGGFFDWVDDAKDFFSDVFETASDKVTDITSNVGTKLKDFPETAQKALSSFIESIAIMLVTSCLIPILVILAFIWLAKVILKVNIDLPAKGLLAKKTERKALPEIDTENE